MSDKSFSFDTVATLIAALDAAKVPVGVKHYKMMAQLDGTRSANAYQHQFRKVKARAKELALGLGTGEVLVVNGTPAKAKTTTGTKRGHSDADETNDAKKAKDEDANDAMLEDE